MPDPQRGWRSTVARGLLQFLIIFTSVTLSFAAEDWRQSLGNRRVAQGVLRGVATDLMLDEPRLDGILQFNVDAVRAGTWLHQNWERQDLPEDSVRTALRTLHFTGPYIPIRAEFESAKSSGRLQLLPDQVVRDRITRHYEVEQLHQVLVNQYTIDLDSRLMTALQPHVAYDADFTDLVPGVGLRNGWATMRDDPAIRSALVQSTIFRNVSAVQMAYFRDQARELREEILRELGR